MLSQLNIIKEEMDSDDEKYIKTARGGHKKLVFKTYPKITLDTQHSVLFRDSFSLELHHLYCFNRRCSRSCVLSHAIYVGVRRYLTLYLDLRSSENS
jgi:hypothetical protein